MSAQKFQAPAQGPELRAALVQLRPFFTRAGWFSLFASVLVKNRGQTTFSDILSPF